MKLCIHCVHFTDHPDSKDPKYGLCEASPKTYSPVTGAIERDHEFCSSYRISSCGIKARFFIPILGLEPDHEVANELPDAQVFPITMHTAEIRKALEAEREACAKLCEDLVLSHPGRADLTADQCAAAIRARGQA